MNAEGRNIPQIENIKLTAPDKWIISKLEECIKEVTLNLNHYELGVACDKVTGFMWDDFCDWYIELTKSSLYGEDEQKKDNSVGVLLFVLKTALKLLHPFIPFATEEIYSNLPGTEGSIMIADYPRYNSKMAYKKEAKAFEGIMNIIKTVRNIKANVGCAPSKKVELYVLSESSKRSIQQNKSCILKLAGASDIKFVDDSSSITEKTISHVCDICQIYIPLGELVDVEKEKERLNAELEKVNFEIQRAGGKLANTKFVEKAPKNLVEEERAKLNKYLEKRKKIEQQIADL